jgi:hypothetical protein
MTFDPMWLLASFGGGLIGAAVGALPIFVLCGFAAILGAAINLATGDATINNLVAFGPILGPQISFAGGAAAAVYAARIGKLGSGRDIATGLMGLDRADVLLVGGLFGGIGYLLWLAFANLPLIGNTGATNPIALSIVVNAILARVVFGKTGVFGKVRKGDNRWLPSEVASWLPYQSHPHQLLLLGLAVGIAVSWTTIQFPALILLWFGVAAASLIFLQYGTKVPVWHHIALASEQVIVIGRGDVWWGLTFGILAAFLGEIYACLFTAHGDSHIDPPSASLFTTFTIMAVLMYFNAFNLTGAPVVVIGALVAAGGYALMTFLRRPPNTAVTVATSPAAA